jgi:hypothetical protein
MVNAARLGPDEFTSVELFVVDHQLAVQQMQLFDARMAVARIVGSWRKPHKHGNALRLRIDSKHLAG